MKIKTNDFSTLFFKYKDKDNHFSGCVVDNSYHFSEGFSVDITIVTNGFEREHSVDFYNQFSAFCFLHSFYNNFFEG